MNIDTITITQNDKYKTVVYPHYTDAEECTGSVVVLHGMAEHHDRYNEFADFLNAHGYDVFLYDHRGHGKDKKYEELGHFADNNGYRPVINDAKAVLDYVGRRNRGYRLILFGHSMGSLIARNVAAEYPDIDALILCGTAQQPGILTGVGSLLASIVKSFKGADYRSPFLSNLTTGYKEFARISNRTKFDWLSRDNNVVGLYINDPCCGFLCTAAFYHDLIHLTGTASSTAIIRKMSRNLPILVISGTDDPVGGYGKGIVKFFSLLQKYGFDRSDCIIYDECRHELLNELNKDEIMQDIVNWLGKIGDPDDTKKTGRTAQPDMSGDRRRETSAGEGKHAETSVGEVKHDEITSGEDDHKEISAGEIKSET
ncbi:MAG: alpha/beta hydrolase [Lachnospiraceae bacterium]|nr:alpha/beta hydrolase [Lachnospiraceae bacterium]